MRAPDIDSAVASVNPISEREAAADVPPAVNRAMIDHITASSRMPFGLRTISTVFGNLDQARGRVGFVAAVSFVVLAALGINALSSGRTDDASTTEPAIDVTTLDPDPVNRSESGDPEIGDGASGGASDGLSGGSGNDDALDVAVADPPPEDAGVGVTSAPPVAGGSAETPPVTGEDQTTSPTTDTQPAPGEPDGLVEVDAASYFGRCVAIEGERLPLVGSWRAVDDPAASDGGYIVWEGLPDGDAMDAPTDILRVAIRIDQPGNYRFAWSMRQPDGADGPEANSSWLNFPDAARFGSTGGGTFGGFVNVVGFGTGRFVWDGKADEGRSQSDIAIEFERAGVYTIEVAARSAGHQIDRVLIYPEWVNRSDATVGSCS